MSNVYIWDEDRWRNIFLYAQPKDENDVIIATIPCDEYGPIFNVEESQQILSHMIEFFPHNDCLVSYVNFDFFTREEAIDYLNSCIQILESKWEKKNNEL